MPTDHEREHWLLMQREALMRQEVERARERQAIQRQQHAYAQHVLYATLGGSGSGGGVRGGGGGVEWALGTGTWITPLVEESAKSSRFPEYSDVQFNSLSHEPLVKEIMPGMFKINKKQADERIKQHLGI